MRQRRASTQTCAWLHRHQPPILDTVSFCLGKLSILEALSHGPKCRLYWCLLFNRVYRLGYSQSGIERICVVDVLKRMCSSWLCYVFIIVWKSFVLKTVFRIRIHVFLGLPDPDPLVRCMDPDPDPSIIMQKRKTLNPTILCLFLTFYLWKIM